MASERTQRRIELLLDEAEDAITQLNWHIVRDRAQAVLALDPGNGDAVNFLAAAVCVLGSDSVPPNPQSQTTPTEPPTPPQIALEAERRQLTVMLLRPTRLHGYLTAT